MSKRADDPVSSGRSIRMRTLPGWRQWGALSVAVMLAIGVPFAGYAQEASPVSAECDAPPLPPGTPTSLEDVASPEAASASEATPETGESESATAPAGTPADASTTGRATSAVGNIIGCLSTGNALGFAALVTPNYLLNEYDMTNPYDMEYVFEGMPTFELLAAENVQTHADGRTSIEVTTIIGGSQVDRFRAYFVEGDQGYLLLDEEVSMPVAADVTVDVALLDYSFELSQTTVPANTLVGFEVR